ncbi:CD1845 family protein [Peptacetobacter sp.]|uniref:CD1845 family protein n=1 Tax=Peptacetobacter sp. TaxID=2991975 RepID=UPI0026241CA9|nr:CD1845 family protein [Peptacetobacter sp.]
MRLVLKTILFPVILIMSIILAFAKFIVSISGVLLGLFSFLIILGALACFVQSDIDTGIQALIIAFILSPYGLPKIAVWIIAFLEYGKDKLKEI